MRVEESGVEELVAATLQVGYGLVEVDEGLRVEESKSREVKENSFFDMTSFG